MAHSDLEQIINQFNAYTAKPVKFLEVQSHVKDDIKNLVKSVYNFTKTQENVPKKVKKSALPKLIVQEFDEEQIWQQIELQNSECWDKLVWDVANCMSSKNNLLFPVKTCADITEEPLQSDKELSDAGSDDLLNDNVGHNTEVLTKKNKQNNKNVSHSPKQYPKKVKSSIVDDKFFKLQEMEQFLLKEEKNEGKTVKQDSDDESIDMFEDIDDEEEDDEQMMYKDFFDIDDDVNGQSDNGEVSDENDYFNENVPDDEFTNVPNENPVVNDKEVKKSKKKTDKKVHFAQDSSSDDEDSEIETAPTKLTDEKKSDFELRQQRLKQQIERLEQRTLKDAPWQLKGEVDANKRPQNSLLQEVVDFDLTSRPPPIITEETTLTLEDIIKQRVKDKAWDDVVKKEKPVDDQLVFRKKEIIDQSKSKLSLAQVYEAEYLKQKQALSGEDQEEKEPENHIAIRDTMTKLFAKLDALCHYHYTPKAVQADVKIITNTPAISMEEVAPIATSDATLLAPEEVKKKQKGDLLAKEERTQTDKNRERRKKKKLQRKKGNVNKVTEQRNTKKGTEADDKSLKTSKAFFQQLNDDAKSMIKGKNKRNLKNKGE